MSSDGSLNLCTGSFVFGCRQIRFGLGGTAPNSISTKLVGISEDGRFVLGVTAATNIVPADANGDPDLVRIDTVSGASLLMNTVPGGGVSPTGATGGALSRDGRFVAVVSQDSLVLGQAPTTKKQVYLRDLSRDTIRQVSVSFSATNGDDWSGNPVVSDNGRHVAFSSYAKNLVAGDTNNEHDLFLRDLDLGRTQRVNLGPVGEQLSAGVGDRWTEPRWMSGDARIIAFSTSDPLYGGRPPLPGDPASLIRQVVVHNVGTGALRLASSAPSGYAASGDASGIAVTRTGAVVSFASTAGTLVADAPGAGVYVRNMENSVPVPVPQISGGGPAPSLVNFDGSLSSDADGSIASYQWDFGDGSSAVGATATHNYPAAGDYRVLLTVVDDEGGRATEERLVSVGHPSIALSSAVANVEWNLGDSRGRLRFQGTSSGPVRATFALVAGRRRIEIGTRSLPGGRFVETFTAPKWLRPGGYGIEISPAGVRAASAATLSRLVVKAPPWGIVDDLTLIAASGRRLGGVPPAGARRVAVRFRVLVPPRGGRTIEARWTSPLGPFHVLKPTPVGRSSLFRFGFKGVGSSALPKGDYECKVMVGEHVLGVVKFAVVQ